MIAQSASTPSFLKPQSPHLHIDGETCPWCEQEIPPERLEEIRGKIEVREREQRHAITAKLEQQYAIDKEQADAKAKADLELERRQSAAREAAAREEARKAAEAAAAEKLADAQPKSTEAEDKLAKLSEQFEITLNERLGSLREVMEKAKDDAINAEKAKAFAEHQKLTSDFNDLKRKYENKTAAELGEGAEIDLFEALKKEFPDDQIERVPKGAPGPDIIHVVRHNGRECGTIIYDSKNHKRFLPAHVTKLREDQLAAKGRARNSLHTRVPAWKVPTAQAGWCVARQPCPSRVGCYHNPRVLVADPYLAPKQRRTREQDSGSLCVHYVGTLCSAPQPRRCACRRVTRPASKRDQVAPE
jgi:hypothetical protein